MKVYTLNAFANEIDWWNPAWVVFNSENLSDYDKQLIAQKVWFSETAFVEKSDNADFKVRFFTPNGEVDLCGHATIATFYLMLKLGFIEVWKYTQETKAWILSIEAKEDNTIFMDQNSPEFFDKIDRSEIADSLNISTELILSDLPIQIVSTWLRDIFIPIRSLKDLHNINPNFEKVSQISKKYDVIGYHMFTLDTYFNSTAHCRNLAPLYDIPEEAATWTSSWALSCYLFKYWNLEKNKINNIVFEQWYSMSRPSEILVKLETTWDDVSKVKVWGVASNIQEKEI